MSRRNIVIIKETHRGLLYEDGTLRDVLPSGRYNIPGTTSSFASFFGAKKPRVDLVLVDMRGRDRTVVIQDFLTAEGATISASFVLQYRVTDPRAAIQEVKNFDERLYAEVQTLAMRTFRGMTLLEVMNARDEIGEEVARLVAESAKAYGLELTSLDFKDLVVPEDVRKLMNRAVLANRVRQAQEVDDLDLDAGYNEELLPMTVGFDLDSRGDRDAEGDLVFARSAEVQQAGGPSIRPIDFDRSNRGGVTTGFDPSRRRARR